MANFPRADLSSIPALELGGRLAVASVTSAPLCACVASSCRMILGSITLSPATISTSPSKRIRSSKSAPLRAASPVPRGWSWKANGVPGNRRLTVPMTLSAMLPTTTTLSMAPQRL
ncbi:MAG TPA: hypothetical protein P5205_14835 [Candidatus Paceibacterota bacterium]|nr:hypothetical protein [Verrucomicrobiota bacterium]HSA11637.1 hypothetical protein [Candidatus Paceibacterota bacterium]